jgi:hypothetical protein
MWKKQINENFRTTFSGTNYDRPKNMKLYRYLDSMLKNDGRCICEIKSRIAMVKAAFDKKRALFTGTLDVKLRKKLVNRYIWSVDFYGAETSTFRALDQKHLERFETRCWRRMEKTSCTGHVRNEEVLLRVKEQRNILLELKTEG